MDIGPNLANAIGYVVSGAVIIFWFYCVYFKD